MINNYKTYPKEFRYDCPPIQKDKCFVIMPFDKELNKVYGNIKAQLEEEGYHCVRADEVAGSTSIMGKILNQMLSSQFVIADITNANPNVFYELGVAHSYKDASNVIIIKEETKECPFDITHLSYITYSNNNMLLLTSKILSTMQEIKYVSDFQDVLNVKGIINYINDSSNRFSNSLQFNLNFTSIKNIFLIEASLSSNIFVSITNDISKVTGFIFTPNEPFSTSANNSFI